MISGQERSSSTILCRPRICPSMRRRRWRFASLIWESTAAALRPLCLGGPMTPAFLPAWEDRKCQRDRVDSALAIYPPPLYGYTGRERLSTRTEPWDGTAKVPAGKSALRRLLSFRRHDTCRDH